MNDELGVKLLINYPWQGLLLKKALAKLLSHGSRTNVLNVHHMTQHDARVINTFDTLP